MNHFVRTRLPKVWGKYCDKTSNLSDKKLSSKFSHPQQWSLSKWVVKTSVVFTNDRQPFSCSYICLCPYSFFSTFYLWSCAFSAQKHFVNNLKYYAPHWCQCFIECFNETTSILIEAQTIHVLYCHYAVNCGCIILQFIYNLLWDFDKATQQSQNGI